MLNQLLAEIEPVRQALLAHPIYHDLQSISALRTFMQQHVFAVWDFMSLLKALQQRLCCVTIPWIPPVDPDGSRLINEIVLGEETDEDGRGGHASHFELYQRSMVKFGADTSQIDRFLQFLCEGQPVSASLVRAEVSPAISAFVQHTFAVIDRGDIRQIASAFTFGREDLLPGVFQKIVDELSLHPQAGLEEFQFYLQRHVELDGEHHGPLSHRLMQNLCGTDAARWRAATAAAVAALEVRLKLWDAIHTEIRTGG